MCRIDRRTRSRLARGMLAVGAVSLLMLSSAAKVRAEAPPQPMIGMEAPGFALDTVAGDRLGLTDLKGRYVVLHFGASW